MIKSAPDQGNTINISTPDFAGVHFKSELVKYAALVKKAGVVPQQLF